jgi:hypothetical protein
VTGHAHLAAGTAGAGRGRGPPPRRRLHRGPTAFAGDPPPGLSGDPLRYLHGPGAGGPAILDDAMGVRIQSVGDAFLISSNSEERHLLQDAADGTTLWEGDRPIDRFGTDGGGADVLVVGSGDDDGDTTVVDAEGATLWSGTGGRDVYVGGAVLRRPEGWTADDPYGDLALLDTEGDPLWDFAFAAPPDAGEGAEAPSPSPPPAGDAPDPDPGRMGVPVAARDGVALLDDGAGLLQARDIGGDPGELLWSATGDDPDLAGEAALPRPLPRVVGFYDVPAPGDGGTGGTPSASGTPSPDGPGAAPARTAVLVRWAFAEDPSLLSLHDLRGGEVLWTLTEPGANPAGPAFDPGFVPGTVHDPATGTLLLPQAGGATPMIAVDLAAGRVRWEFDADEQAISPAFALGGRFYGDSRGADDAASSQVVLDAETKDVVAEGLDAYVEAVTDDGHAVVVADRQRFVFAPEDAPATGGPATPTG